MSHRYGLWSLERRVSALHPAWTTSSERVTFVAMIRARVLPTSSAPPVVARTGTRPWRVMARAFPYVFTIAAIAGWEATARGGWISPVLFPAPSTIVRHLPALWRAGFAGDVAATLVRFFAGLALGAGSGVVAGMLIGSSESLRLAFDPLVSAIHPVPKLILLPLLIVVVGVGEASAVLAIALTVFFPALMNAAAGARQIAPSHFDVVRNYGGGRADTIRHVLIPGSLPMTLTGLRIAANMGLTITISIEFALAPHGIGSVLWLAWQTMRTEEIYAGIAVVALVGIAVNAVILWVGRSVATWQYAQ